MMLQIIQTKPVLRKDALKVVSFGLTKCTIDQAVQFIDQTRGLSVLFSLWMKQPDQVSVLTKEHSKLHEYFLSIFWNLIATLSHQSSKETQVKRTICLERLCFKFVENRFEKLVRLVMLHKIVHARIEEFDLAQFTQMEEIRQLEEHFNLDLLILVDSIMASLCVTNALEKFLTDQSLKADLLKTSTVQLFGGDDSKIFSEITTILGLQVTRCGDSDLD